MGAAGKRHCDASFFGGGEDRGHVAVEGEGLAPAVQHARVVLRMWVGRFQGSRHVCVDPEGPEGVVEIEDYKGREG